MPQPRDGAPRAIILIFGDRIRPSVTSAFEQVMEAMHVPVHFDRYQVRSDMKNASTDVIESIRKNKAAFSPASWKCSEEYFSQQIKSHSLSSLIYMMFPNVWALQLVRQLLVWDPNLAYEDAFHPWLDSSCLEVKDSLRNDPRYKSIKHEDREILFNEYISELKSAEVEVERAAKAKQEEQLSTFLKVEICLKPSSTARIEDVHSAVEIMLEKRSLSYIDGPVPVPLDDSFLVENVQRICVCDTDEWVENHDTLLFWHVKPGVHVFQLSEEGSCKGKK
ncbi:hypothetical protein LOK49_LG03G03059 [Camellia lanceoleosa]|uniref:Uncharacterized protein n=1 Tax=Camellia lanceoleosa TaxID=1840588 RepID=A0ACC0IGH8_9ERIC|nr:hypothetical protein LOK49_LG03G03059 [Camellia lanceoleosa]